MMAGRMRAIESTICSPVLDGKRHVAGARPSYWSWLVLSVAAFVLITCSGCGGGDPEDDHVDSRPPACNTRPELCK